MEAVHGTKSLVLVGLGVRLAPICFMCEQVVVVWVTVTCRTKVIPTNPICSDTDSGSSVYCSEWGRIVG